MTKTILKLILGGVKDTLCSKKSFIKHRVIGSLSDALPKAGVDLVTHGVKSMIDIEKEEKRGKKRIEAKKSELSLELQHEDDCRKIRVQEAYDTEYFKAKAIEDIKNGKYDQSVVENAISTNK